MSFNRFHFGLFDGQQDGMGTPHLEQAPDAGRPTVPRRDGRDGEQQLSNGLHDRVLCPEGLDCALERAFRYTCSSPSSKVGRGGFASRQDGNDITCTLLPPSQNSTTEKKSAMIELQIRQHKCFCTMTCSWRIPYGTDPTFAPSGVLESLHLHATRLDRDETR